MLEQVVAARRRVGQSKDASELARREAEVRTAEQKYRVTRDDEDCAIAALAAAQQQRANYIRAVLLEQQQQK